MNMRINNPGALRLILGSMSVLAILMGMAFRLCNAMMFLIK